MPYTPIIGTLGYILSADRQKTLLVHRNARPEDLHLGKYNGLGGKMRPDEEVIGCLRREIREESGLEIDDIVLRGTVNWTGFGINGENWLGFIFRIDKFSGRCFDRNPEGTLGWHAIRRLPELPMWEGDKHFLPLVFDDDPRVFYGYMPYANGRPLDWRFTRL